MIYINNDFFDRFKCIGSGKFGKVYKINNNTAYKIYYKMVADDYSGKELINPVFGGTNFHYKLLLSKSKNLIHSGGIKDLISINGSFGGVSIPYYEGSELIDLFDKPLKLKIDISKKLIRNCKELTDCFIYPTDFRLKNIILSNNEPQIIDLDDTRTKVSIMPNLLWEKYCINKIGENIQYFLGITNHKGIPSSIRKVIKRENAFNCINYNKIINYIKNLEIEKNIIFINKETNLDKIKELINNNSFELVYIIDNNLEKKDYINIVNNLKKENIILYDFINKEKIEDYSSIEMVNESYLLDNKELKKIPQKRLHI